MKKTPVTARQKTQIICKTLTRNEVIKRYHRTTYCNILSMLQNSSIDRILECVDQNVNMTLGQYGVSTYIAYIITQVNHLWCSHEPPCGLSSSNYDIESCGPTPPTNPLLASHVVMMLLTCHVAKGYDPRCILWLGLL